MTLALALGACATALLYAAGWPADRYLHNDYAGFWAGSRSLIEGRDPYDAIAWLELHERMGSHGLAIVPPQTGFGYPLTTAVAFLPFALLPVSLAAPLWFISQAAAALASLAALARRLSPGTVRRDLPVLLALCVASQPARVFAEGGNLGGVLLAIPAAGLALLLGGRPFAAGLVLGLVVVKPHPFLLAIPLVLLSIPRGDARRLAAGALVTGGALVLLAFILRPGWIGEWLVSIARIQAVPVGRANAYGLFPPEWRALGLVLVGALVVGFVVWVRRCRPSPGAVAAAALPLSLFAAPYGWSYDHSVLLVTSAVIIAAVAHAAERTRASLLVLLAVVTIPLPWMLYVLAFSRGEEAWSAVVPVAVLSVLALALTRPGRRTVGCAPQEVAR